MIPLSPRLFAERCRLWARLVEALDHHPDRDELSQAMQGLDKLYGLELQELVNAAHANALAAGAQEREHLRAVIVEQQERLDQALTAMVTPPTTASAEVFH